MKARLIIQHNDAIGATNLHFVTDPLVMLDDFAVIAGTWMHAPMREIWVDIECKDDTALTLLEAREFRCTDNSLDDGLSLEPTDPLRDKVDGALRRSNMEM